MGAVITCSLGFGFAALSRPGRRRTLRPALERQRRAARLDQMRLTG